MSSPLQAQTLARLTFAARALDLAISLLAARVIFQRINQYYYSEYLFLLVAFATIVLHLFITQILLGDRSIGRMCLGLSTVEASTKKSPSMRCRISQFMKKITCMGFDGFNANSLPRAACDSRVIIQSDLLENGGRRFRPSGGSGGRWWGSGGSRSADPSNVPTSLIVESGPNAGAVLHLDPSRPPQIGRNPVWSDLDLSASGKVSRKHAVMRFIHGHWELTDHGSVNSQEQSSNGTFHNTKEIGLRRWAKLRVGDEVRLGDVRLKVRG